VILCARPAWLKAAAIEPHLPKNQPGARQVDDRRVISGVLHVLKVGCRQCDCPAEYRPSTTVYNSFNRWSPRGLWLKLLDALVDGGTVTRSSTYVKAQRAVFGATGGARRRRSGGGWTTKVRALTDVIGRPYALMLTPGRRREGCARAPRTGRPHALPAWRQGMRCRPAAPGSRGRRRSGHPGRRNRKRAIPYDKQRYRDRHLIENAFCPSRISAASPPATTSSPPTSF